jgi:hypothetical protein
VWVEPSATPGPSTFPSAASYTAPPSRSVPTTEPPVTSTQSAALATSTSNPSSGLSTGAKAGIGAGIAGGVLFLAAIALATLCLRRRSNRRKQPPLPGPPQYPNSLYSAPSPMQGTQAWPPYPPGVIPEHYFHHAGQPFGQETGQYRERGLSAEEALLKQKAEEVRQASVPAPLELAADAPARHEMAGAETLRQNGGRL